MYNYSLYPVSHSNSSVQMVALFAKELPHQNVLRDITVICGSDLEKTFLSNSWRTFTVLQSHFVIQIGHHRCVTTLSALWNCKTKSFCQSVHRTSWRTMDVNSAASLLALNKQSGSWLINSLSFEKVARAVRASLSYNFLYCNDMHRTSPVLSSPVHPPLLPQTVHLRLQRLWLWFLWQSKGPAADRSYSDDALVLWRPVRLRTVPEVFVSGSAPLTVSTLFILLTSLYSVAEPLPGAMSSFHHPCNVFSAKHGVCTEMALLQSVLIESK